MSEQPTDDDVDDSRLGRRTFMQSTAAASLAGLAASGSALADKPDDTPGRGPPAGRGRGNGGGGGGTDEDIGVGRDYVTKTFELRKDAARAQILHEQVPDYETPERREDYAGTFSKGLPHDANGEVDQGAYETLVDALEGEADFGDVPLAGDRKLVNPSASRSRCMQGAATAYNPTPAYPAFDSAETATEMVELYWMALARDVPFSEYGTDSLIADAASELSGLGADQYGIATNASTLFRASLPGAKTGPFVSQFLYTDIPRGANSQDARIQVYEPGENYITSYDQWLAIQRGEAPTQSPTVATTRYPITGRDLSAYVDANLFGKMFRNAALILFDMDVPLDSGIPSRSTESRLIDWSVGQIPSVVPGILPDLLRFTWFNKWQLHRRARPEVLGGRLHLDQDPSAPDYPLDPLLENSTAVQRTHANTGTYLLPQAYPRGSPCHPAYPAGHGVIAGGCTTVLKAFFDVDTPIPNPVEPTADGSALQPLGQSLTVEGELNKLATNNARGRDFAGIHYLSDGFEGILAGEQFAIEWLEDQLAPQALDAALTLQTFDGDTVTIDPSA